ncbi:hypothetical protein Q8A73_006511 [Channa argus]|nr:hypothetical protein Q8A73_006511 [Channa argus]
MDGDYVIGGVFSIHSNMHTVKHNYTTMPEPLRIDSEELGFSRAMTFAIDSINNSTKLLPGIRLGYQIYDSCASVPMTVKVAFQLTNGLDPVFYIPDNCSQSGMVMAVVGESGSTPSISMSRIIAPFNIPQVSHFATCACLSNKQQYPNFFRTIPSDQFQAEALAKLVKQFGWTWIGAVRSDSDYGNNGMASFLKAAYKEGICVEYSESFYRTHPRSRIQRVADVIRRSTAKVVVAFVSFGDMSLLMEEMSCEPSPSRQWIGSESWVTHPDMLKFTFCAGAIGFGIPQSVIPGLRDFLLDLSPSEVAASPILTEFWEDAFNCKLEKSAATNRSLCDGTEDIKKLQSLHTDKSQLRVTVMVYNAVYAIAHAIHNAVCQETNSTSQCDKLSRIESKQIFTQLKKVKFSLNGYNVSFDANGDPVAKYELVNWQKSKSGIIELVSVGYYDASLPVGQELCINKNITWVEGRTQLQDTTRLPAFSNDGDYVIGGIFSIHTYMYTVMNNYTTMPELLRCTGRIDSEELSYSRAMIFAIEEINNSTKLLPGIRLGYQIHDSCASIPMTVKVAFQLTNGLDKVFYTNSNCSPSHMVMAIVGGSGSTPSITMSRIIGLFNISQVSHFATCACLSNKQQYPNFFRTIPSDHFQADALAKLVKQFGWTWIGAVRSDSDYGNNGMASFLKAAYKEGICVEYSESFNRYHPLSRIQRVADVIRRSTAMVVVAFSSFGDMRLLLEELSRQPSPPRQWVGSEGWIIYPDLRRFTICGGAIGFGIPRSVIPGLRDFLLDLSPAEVAASPVLTEFWEDAFNCSLGKSSATDKRLCDGTEDIHNLQNPYTDTSQLRATNLVYKGVYAVAHAIHNAVCQETHSATQCDKLSRTESKQVLTQLKKVNFSQNGYHVSFDANGDPVAKYELVNWPKSKSGSLELVTVGYYDASLPVGQEFNINKKITWLEGRTHVPVSVCSDSCPPGTHKVLQKGKPICCYDCIPCPEGEISNDTEELHFSHAMIFAIEEINNSTKLLPGIRLGYQIHDSCASVPMAVKVAFQLTNGLDQVFYTSNNCSKSRMVMAVVGGSASTPSISMSRIIGPFNIPQVSHFATCACLSNKQQYPNFFRTIPSDQFQAEALAKLVKQFGWTWIGAVRSDSDYGNNGMASFLATAHKEGICVEYSESFNRYQPPSRIQRVADVIRRSTAMVIVAFVAFGDMRLLLEELSRELLPPRQWIGSEGWVTHLDVPRFPICRGAIGFGIPQSVIPGLRDFLLDLSPTKVATSPILTEFWEDVFNCRLEKSAVTEKRLCDGTEEIQKLRSPYTDTSQLRITNMVYKAIYAVAHAIHNAVCQETNSTTQCDKLSRMDSKQVLTQLKKVNISQNGYPVSFDANGDPVAAYELVNWQKSKSGSLEIVTVGYYDASLPVGQEFHINKNITWMDERMQVPVSVCSDSCPPGTHKVLQKGKPICCYDCIPCPEGEISNATDSPNCFLCPKEFWPNAERDTCFPKPVEFLSFSEVLGIMLAAFSIGGACLALTIAIRVADVIRRSTAIVVVAFASFGDMTLLMEELSHEPSPPPRQWIGSEGWVTDRDMLKYTFCAGAIGFGIPRSVIPGLRDFLLDLSPTKVASSPILAEFWEDAFNCRLEKSAVTDKRLCDGTEDIQQLQTPYTDTSQLRITNMVYKAVYAIAHAIHNAVCQETNSITQCDKLSRIESKQVLIQLKNVNFSQNGYHVSFDANGDPVATYELVNWQKSKSDSLEIVTVGYYDASLSVGQEFHINKNLTWMEGWTQVPASVCSDSCPPGTHKVLQKGKPICCYDCIPCPEGEISNATDLPNCFPCPNEFWPNARRDTCIPKPVEFLSFREVLGIILAAFSN